MSPYNTNNSSPGRTSSPVPPTLSGWLMAWCLFYIVVNVFSLWRTFGLLGDLPDDLSTLTYMLIAVLIAVSIGAIAGAGLLMLARKMGLYILIAVTVVGIVINLWIGEYKGLLSLVGLAITWLLVHKDWSQFR